MANRNYDTDLIQFNPKYLPNTFFLPYNGNKCYMATLLECLLSCTAFNEYVIKNQRNINECTTGKHMIQLVQETLRGRLTSSTYPNDIMKSINHDNGKMKFGEHTQESTSEAMIYLVSILNKYSQGFEDIILHRVRNYILCGNCNKVISEKIEYNITYDFIQYQNIRNSKDFSKTIREYKEKLLDYKCEHCGYKTTETTPNNKSAHKVVLLTRLPEILVCMFNIYVHREPRYFPKTLDFPSVNKKKALRYILSAQAIHSGSLNGGHYTARVIRKDNLDSNCLVTNHSDVYLAFYQFYKKIDISLANI